MRSLVPARAADLPALNALILQAIDGWALPARVKRLTGPSHCYDEIDLKTMHIAFLPAEDGQALGLVALETTGVDEAPLQPAWRLHGIYVAPTAQKSGVGRALLAWVQETAQRAGVRALTVRAQRDAIGFFRALGFEPLPATTQEPAYPHQFFKRLP
jgi:GNAT superfamily N-acetyltransferase